MWHTCSCIWVVLDIREDVKKKIDLWTESDPWMKLNLLTERDPWPDMGAWTEMEKAVVGHHGWLWWATRWQRGGLVGARRRLPPDLYGNLNRIRQLANCTLAQ